MLKKGIVFFLGLVFLLVAPTVYAWDYQGPPDLVRDLKAEVATLPPCVLKHIEHKLHKVVIVREKELPDNVDGMSFPDGTMLLKMLTPTNVYPLTSVFVHELGHFYDFDTDDSSTLSFQRAVYTDFSAMKSDQRFHNLYLSVPAEAWAELFAENMLGTRYDKTRYDAGLFKESQQILRTELWIDCD